MLAFEHKYTPCSVIGLRIVERGCLECKGPMIEITLRSEETGENFKDTMPPTQAEGIKIGQLVTLHRCYRNGRLMQPTEMMTGVRVGSRTSGQSVNPATSKVR